MEQRYDLFQINRDKDYDRIPVLIDDSLQLTPIVENGRIYAIKIEAKKGSDPLSPIQ